MSFGSHNVEATEWAQHWSRAEVPNRPLPPEIPNMAHLAPTFEDCNAETDIHETKYEVVSYQTVS